MIDLCPDGDPKEFYVSLAAAESDEAWDSLLVAVHVTMCKKRLRETGSLEIRSLVGSPIRTLTPALKLLSGCTCVGQFLLKLGTNSGTSGGQFAVLFVSLGMRDFSVGLHVRFC